jgi:hypothetical protein
MVAYNDSPFVSRLKKMIAGGGAEKAMAIEIARSQLEQWKTQLRCTGQLAEPLRKDMESLAELLYTSSPPVAAKIEINLKNDLQID